MSSPLARRPSFDLLVLCYHAVDPGWSCELAVHPRDFETQVVGLLRRGYEPTTFTDAVLDSHSGRRRLAITFDDGYRSVATHAAPILHRLGAVATIFVPTAFMGRERPMSWSGVDQWAAGRSPDSVRPLHWDQIRRLADAGWEIGSHARTHPMLTVAGDDELWRELAGSKAEIEQRIDRTCRSIAYPYGDVDPRVAESARATGYEAGAGLHPVDPAPSPLNWPRTSIYPVDRRWRYATKISPTIRRSREWVHAALS